MSIKNLYTKLSKWSFFAFLLIWAAIILMLNILPRHKNVISYSEQCYWTNALIVYIECGASVPLGEIVKFILNMVYGLAVLPLMPFYILFFPPILWVFVISFYFLVASYPLLKIRRRFWGELAPEKTDILLKIIKRIFILLLAMSIIFQTYQSYKKHLVNTTYWQAKLGIIADNFKNDKDYIIALRTAIRRGETDMVKVLFRDGYNRNSELFTIVVDSGNYDLVDFFLTHDIEAKSQVLKVSFERIISHRICEKTDDSNYKILERLLKEIKSIDNKLLRIPAISLCSPLMEILLKSNVNPSYITPEGESLLDLVKKIEVTSNNAYNGWLYGESQETIEKYRKQMIDLISKYQKDKK